jgi:hypothetical protein
VRSVKNRRVAIAFGSVQDVANDYAAYFDYAHRIMWVSRDLAARIGLTIGKVSRQALAHRGSYR